MRLDVANVERETAVELVSLLDARDLLVGGRDVQALIDCVVGDGDLLGRHVEPAQDVVLGGFRHREDAIRALGRRPELRPRVAVGQPVRQVLREHQVDAVVNGHHRAAVDQRRQHVVRLVEQVDALACQRHRQADLLGDRVGTRRFGDRAEIRADLPDRRAVLLAAQQHVLRLGVDPGQLEHQVPDVGADAEVVEFSGVDGDAHRTSPQRVLRDDTGRSRESYNGTADFPNFASRRGRGIRLQPDSGTWDPASAGFCWLATWDPAVGGRLQPPPPTGRPVS